jgi:hypothetical protein
VKELDRALVVRTLKANRGIIFKAAKALGVPSHDLRRLTFREPDLIALAREEDYLIVDRARMNPIEALHDPDDYDRRDKMTRFVLSSPIAIGTGFSQREPKDYGKEPEKKVNIVFGWSGLPGFGPPEPDVMVEEALRARKQKKDVVEQPAVNKALDGDIIPPDHPPFERSRFVVNATQVFGVEHEPAQEPTVAQEEAPKPVEVESPPEPKQPLDILYTYRTRLDFLRPQIGDDARFRAYDYVVARCVNRTTALIVRRRKRWCAPPWRGADGGSLGPRIPARWASFRRSAWRDAAAMGAMRPSSEGREWRWSKASRACVGSVARQAPARMGAC